MLRHLAPHDNCRLKVHRGNRRRRAETSVAPMERSTAGWAVLNTEDPTVPSTGDSVVLNSVDPMALNCAGSVAPNTVDPMAPNCAGSVAPNTVDPRVPNCAGSRSAVSYQAAGGSSCPMMVERIHPNVQRFVTALAGAPTRRGLSFAPALCRWDGSAPNHLKKVDAVAWTDASRRCCDFATVPIPEPDD